MFCILLVSFCLLPNTQVMWAVQDDSSKEALKCRERTQRAAVCAPNSDQLNHSVSQQGIA